MTNITFSVDDDLYKKMKDHPEIKWSEIFRESIRRYLHKLENPNRISGKELFQKVHIRAQEYSLEEELKLRNRQEKIELERLKNLNNFENTTGTD